MSALPSFESVWWGAIAALSIGYLLSPTADRIRHGVQPRRDSTHKESFAFQRIARAAGLEIPSYRGGSYADDIADEIITRLADPRALVTEDEAAVLIGAVMGADEHYAQEPRDNRNVYEVFAWGLVVTAIPLCVGSLATDSPVLLIAGCAALTVAVLAGIKAYWRR